VSSHVAADSPLTTETPVRPTDYWLSFETRSGDVLIDSAIAGGRVDHASRRPDAGHDSADAQLDAGPTCYCSAEASPYEASSG